MQSTDTLMEEHVLILEALDALGLMSRRIGEGRAVALPDALRLLDFFGDFADAWHHGREEGILFPRMVDAGLPPDGGPVAVMLHEHEQGRALLAVMRDSLPLLPQEEEARRRFVDAATWYCDHLSQHIQKEDQVMFRVAEQVLSPEAARDTDEAFVRFAEERQDGGLSQHRALLRQLSAALAAT